MSSSTRNRSMATVFKTNKPNSHNSNEKRERKPRNNRRKSSTSTNNTAVSSVPTPKSTLHYTAILLGIKDGQLFEGVVPAKDIGQYKAILNRQGPGFRAVPLFMKTFETTNQAQNYINDYLNDKLDVSLTAKIKHFNNLIQQNTAFHFYQNFVLNVESVSTPDGVRYAVGIHSIRPTSQGHEEHRFITLIVPAQINPEVKSNEFTAYLYGIYFILCKFIPEMPAQQINGHSVCIALPHREVVRTIVHDALSWDLENWTKLVKNKNKKGKTRKPIKNIPLIAPILSRSGYNNLANNPYKYLEYSSIPRSKVEVPKVLAILGKNHIRAGNKNELFMSSIIDVNKQLSILRAGFVPPVYNESDLGVSLTNLPSINMETTQPPMPNMPAAQQSNAAPPQQQQHCFTSAPLPQQNAVAYVQQQYGPGIPDTYQQQ